MLQGSPASANAAKRLRREMTLPEVLLWQRLKDSASGLKFRRQHPAGDYVVDFYCHRARTIIEIDGFVHQMGNRPARDERRDAWLRNCGLKVVHIPAADVLRAPDEIAAAIVAMCGDTAGEDK